MSQNARHNVYGGGGPAPHLRVFRQGDAKDRAEKRGKLTALQQLQVLDERLGVNVGAEKERARLVAQSIHECITTVEAEKAKKKKGSKAA